MPVGVKKKRRTKERTLRRRLGNVI